MVFELFQKLHLQIYASQIHDIMNYYISICPFESGKCEKEREKVQKFEHLENEQNFLDEVKNIFRSFCRAIVW